MAEKITVTRCLKELQLLPKRIAKLTEELRPLAVVAGGTPPAGYKTVEDFETRARDGFKAVAALIAYQSKLWALVALSNAKTEVTIRGSKMTVTEAIKYRNETAKHRKALLAALMRVSAEGERSITQHTDAYKARLDGLLTTTFGKNTKVREDDTKAVVEPFAKANEPRLLDPLWIKDVIKSLAEEVDDVEKEIDLSLSEVNAVTYITVD